MPISARLQAGRLRHRIDIVKPTNVQDDTGGTSVDNNVVFASCWASVEALSGGETFAASQFISVSTHKIVIRYRPGITTAMQIWFKGRTFQITAVLNPDERTKMLVITAAEINDSAGQPPSPSGLL